MSDYIFINSEIPSYIGLGLVCISYIVLSLMGFDQPPKPQKVVQHSATWKSKIYDNESGTLEIDLMKYEDEDNPSEAKVTINYSEGSDFRPKGKLLLEFSCEYDDWLKTYTLKQTNVIDGQFFVIHFNRYTNSHRIGHLVCVGPADLCDLKFEIKMASKKDD